MAFLNINTSSSSLIFGIVTYREKYWECDSFCSLVESFLNSGLNDQLNIFIVDNTDVFGWNLEDRSFSGNINIKYVNLKNPGISVAYNTINEYALSNSFDWVVYFDQDTTLPLETFSTYSKKSIENNVLLPLKAPIIYSNGGIMSPCIYKKYRAYAVLKFDKTIFRIKEYSCINSGLMIQSNFFHKVGGYNTKLKIDFCDHDFIENSKKYLDNIELLDLELEQNFSADTHDKIQAINRYHIFCKDIKQFYMQRSRLQIFIFVDLPHLLKLTYIYKSASFFKIRLLN